MSVTIAEFQENVRHYLRSVSEQDVFIIEDGEVIAKLTKYNRNNMDSARIFEIGKI